MNIDKAIIQRAINQWGPMKQLGMLQEEAQELALAVHKLLNRDQSEEQRDEVLGEIADVHIMLAQAGLIFDSDKIQKKIDYKLNRLSERLDKKQF